MEALISSSNEPLNPPSHPGSPYDTSGNCIHHPSVKLATPKDNGDTISFTVERKICPKCCLETIIHDTARKSDLNFPIRNGRRNGTSSRSLSAHSVTRSIDGRSTAHSARSDGRPFTRRSSNTSTARSAGAKTRYSYVRAGTNSIAAASVSCASLPDSFEDGLNYDPDRKLDGSNRTGAEMSMSYSRSEGSSVSLDPSMSYYSRRGRDYRSVASNGSDGSYSSARRDPRDIPFRTPKDPSVTSSSITSRRSTVRSQTPESDSYKPSPKPPSPGRRKQERDASSESNSTIGMSTIPSDASTCSTITMDTALFERSNSSRSRHNSRSKQRPFSSDLDPVRELDSRGRDPEEETRSRLSGNSRSHTNNGGRNSSNGSHHIPTQVNVPEKEDDKIILISNMPKDMCQDQDVKSVKSQRSRESGSKRTKDDPSSRSNDDRSKHRRDRDGRRRSFDSQDNTSQPHKKSKSPHKRPPSIKGDTSIFSSHQPSLTSHSTRSHSTRQIRHDVDPNGYCSHHPDIRLMKPDEKDPAYWCVVRKKCPECIREDCPSVFEDRSVRSNYSHGTPFFDEGSESAYSIESSKGSSFFLSTLQTPEEIEEQEDTRRLKRRLAARAYHFPGNTWCEDWFQYISNTHTVLGLFFHHPLHPLKLQERLVILFGSVAIGLTISNLTYMHFIKIGVPVDEEFFTVNLTWLGLSEVVITKLMLTLWTLGSFLHTLFDLGLWHMKACTLCRYGGQIDDRIARWGRVVGLFIVMASMAAGSYAVLLRASIEYKGEGSEGSSVEEAIRNNEFYEINFGGKRSFRFLLGYLVEFLLAMFVYYPIAVTIIFSGVLGCGGRIPILGGRPREIKKERNYAMSKQKTLKTGESGGDDDNTSDVYSTSYRDELEENRII